MKILFICSNLIGDTILSSGAINHFINQNKEAKLTFVVGPTAAPLLKNYKNIENKINEKNYKDSVHKIKLMTARDIIIEILNQDY